MKFKKLEKSFWGKNGGLGIRWLGYRFCAALEKENPISLPGMVSLLHPFFVCNSSFFQELNETILKTWHYFPPVTPIIMEFYKQILFNQTTNELYR